MEEIIVRYIHFLGIILLASMLIVEHVILSTTLSRQQRKTLSRIDFIYGLAAIATLLAGLSLWFVVGKSADFYSQNWIFHLKLSLFVVIGIMSIFPTVFFIKSAKRQEETITVPRNIVFLIRGQLALLCAMPLLGVLIARGVGIN